MGPTGRITDDGVERLRARIGIPEPHPMPPYYTVPTVDTFRNVAIAYGDDNPLWCDPEYGPKTRWKHPIAPPVLVGGDTLIGEDEITAVAPEHAETMKGDPLRGVHAFYAASAREWWAPLLPMRRVFRRNALVAVLDKPSEFAGRAIHEWTAQVFRDDTGSLLSGQYRLMVRTEREKARENKKYDSVTVEPYTDEQIDEIEAQYARERPRGAEPRWFEDVQEGDEVGPMVKGPLTITDMVCWHAGMGMGLYGVKPLRLAYGNRQRIPRFFHRDELNVPDVMQRVHWDQGFAQRSGNPTTFDYGRMRETWLIHLCTDWMGDDAWLWKLDCEFRRFNYVGDTQWLRGRVTRKYLAAGNRPAIDVELTAVNQRGEVTTPGGATMLLPSRVHGAVRLPDPPERGRRSPGGLARDLEGVLAPMTLDVTHDERGVLTLRLDRPEKRNAVDDEMMLALVDAFDTAATDDRVRVIVLEGAGEHFCGGADIVARNANKADRRPRAGSIQRRLPTQAHRLIPQVCAIQVPVVAKVRGWAAGIGFQLALAADFTIAAGDARFWQPFAERGFTPDSGATWLLPRRVGDVRARELLLLGRALTGDEAAAWGAIHRAVAARRVGRDSRRGGGTPRERSHGRARAHEVAAARGRRYLARAAARERGVRARALVAHRGLPRGARGVRREARAPLRRTMNITARRRSTRRSPQCGHGSRRTCRGRGSTPAGAAVPRRCARSAHAPRTRSGTRSSRRPGSSCRPGRWRTAAST